MKSPKIIFWNVDTQNDFIDPKGKLYVTGAEKIKPKLTLITKLAKYKNIQVVNTADHHLHSDEELSENPDFINTFPPHCMAGSIGAEFIRETNPINDIQEVFCNKIYSDQEINNISTAKNIIIRKDKFDVFTGNKNTKRILDNIKPDIVYVYGVTTNVCVDCAVRGLAKLNIETIVIQDAIKELANIEMPYNTWDSLGIKRVMLKDINI